MKNVCMTAWFLLLKEGIDIIDDIKMHDVPIKVQLASQKSKSVASWKFHMLGHT